MTKIRSKKYPKYYMKDGKLNKESSNAIQNESEEQSAQKDIYNKMDNEMLKIAQKRINSAVNEKDAQKQERRFKRLQKLLSK
jgi:hypothetical protein